MQADAGQKPGIGFGDFGTGLKSGRVRTKNEWTENRTRNAHTGHEPLTARS